MFVKNVPIISFKFVFYKMKQLNVISIKASLSASAQMKLIILDSPDLSHKIFYSTSVRLEIL